MKNFFANTFGGLKASYLIRQYIFGICLALLFANIKMQNGQELSLSIAAVLIINTVFYPYSRFVYESIVEFILGENTFYVNGLVMLFVKVITMLFCWVAAIFIAPIGLAYIYFRSTRTTS
ncbi:MAG: hypothetical protein ACI88H_001299 [Cocleimonas sp.]|jgi:hypothetical protein